MDPKGRVGHCLVLAKPRVAKSPLLRLGVRATRLLGRHGLPSLMLRGRLLLLGVSLLLLTSLLRTVGLDSQSRKLALRLNGRLGVAHLNGAGKLRLGLRKLRLLTNNPKKLAGLQGYGIEVVGQEPLVVGSNPHNRKYLETKRQKMGHLLSGAEPEPTP